MADNGPPRLHGFPADKRPGEIPSIACLPGAQRHRQFGLRLSDWFSNWADTFSGINVLFR
jgi:hypothetical protein